MITVIYGLSGSGKTDLCMEIANKAFPACYVVPEPMSYISEKMITEKFGAVSSSAVEVTTFKRMFFNMVSSFGMKGRTLLTEGGKAIILSYLCKKLQKEFKVLSKSAGYRGFAEVASSLISEFKNYGITDKMLQSVATDDVQLKNKLDDLSLLYSAYNEILGEKYATADDESEILASLIKENPWAFADTTYIFDGFSCFIPCELKIIEALSSCCKGIYITLDCDGLQYTDDTDVFFDQKRTIEALSKISELRFIHKKEIYKTYEFSNLTLAFAHKSYKPFESENIKLAVFNNNYDEVTFAAEKILKLVQSGKYRFSDVTVVSRDSTRYSGIIKRIFADHGIPVFISESLNATAQPAVYAILDALEAILKNFSYEAMFSYLKSGFSGITSHELDLLENYILATGIRGSAWISEKAWKYTPEITGKGEDLLTEINHIKNKVATPLANLKVSLTKAYTLRHKAEALFRFTEEIALYDRINEKILRFNTLDAAASAYYSQVWNIFISTLEEIVELLGDKPVTNDEFLEILVTGLSTHELSVIPTTVDSVNVCDPLDCVASPVLFVFGTNEGVYPQIMTDEGILNDSDRLILRDSNIVLAHDTVTRAFSEDFVIYNLMGKPRELLYVTYPISDVNGTARHPSDVISKLNKALEIPLEDNIISRGRDGVEKLTAPLPAFLTYAENMRLAREGVSIDPLWYNVGRWFENSHLWNDRYKLFEKGINFTPNASPIEDISLLFPESDIKLSISRLELYRKCPFAYYAGYGLKLLDRKTDKLDFADTGSLMHEVLEQLSVAMENSGLSWQTADDDYLTRQVNRLVDEKITEIEELFDYKSARRHFLLLRLRENLLTSVMYIAQHLKAGKFVPLGYEISFDDNKKYTPLTLDVGGKKIKLRGKIDRADVYTDNSGRKFLRIIDYKSGKKSFDMTRTYYGLDLQLAVYLDRLCDLENAQPAGVLYFRLHDSLIKGSSDMSDEKIAAALESQHKLSGLIIKDTAVAYAMDSTLKSLPVRIKNDGNFHQNSQVADFDTFAGMRKILHKTLRSLSSELIKGKIPIKPYRSHDGKTGCDYCEYRDLCHFEQRCGGNFDDLPAIPDIMDFVKKEGKTDA